MAGLQYARVVPGSQLRFPGPGNRYPNLPARLRRGWSLISVVTPLPPTVLPLDGLANVPSGGDSLSISLDHFAQK